MQEIKKKLNFESNKELNIEGKDELIRKKLIMKNRIVSPIYDDEGILDDSFTIKVTIMD